MSNTPHSLAHPKYRSDIDGLRALAVLSVVLYHAYPTVFTGGFIGVDIFFVISGFLISSIIFGSLERGIFSFVDFYSRRIRRIFPALILVMISCYAAGSLILYPDEFSQLGKHLIAGSTFISNMVLWKESGYFNVMADSKPLLHLWSLGVEEQFYIFWPLLAWLCWRGRLGFVALTLLALAASFLTNIYLIKIQPISAFYLPTTRFWELLCGALLAWLSLHKTDWLATGTARAGNTLSLLGLALLSVGYSYINKGSAFPGWWATIPVLAAVLLIAAGPTSLINRYLLGNRLSVNLGLISYPLYLWHWPLLCFLAISRGEQASVGARAIAVATSVLLAWLTYRFIEVPVRHKRGSRLLVPSLVCAVVALALVGTYSYFSYFGGIGNKMAATFIKPAPDKSQGPPHIMLIGDSHADHLYPGLSAKLGSAIANHTAVSCIPFYDVDRYDSRIVPGTCSKAMTKGLDLFVNTPEFDTLVMGSMGPVYLSGETFKGKDPARVTGLGVVLTSHPEITDRWAVYERGMRDTLSRLRSTGKHVVFLLDTPELGVDPHACLDKLTLDVFGHPFTVRSYPEGCFVTRADFDNRTSRYRALVTTVLADYPEVQLFDPTPLFCDAEKCHGMHEGQILYRDFDHLTPEGSAYVASYLVPLLGSVR